MATYTLTVLDTPGIQDYIFSSNRLRENIGASELVWQATALWPLKILKAGGNSNVVDPHSIQPNNRLDQTQHIEDGTLTAEVLYVGGGNTLILFKDLTRAKAFVTKLSKRLIEEAPGLNLAATHISIDWDQDNLFDKVNAAMLQLKEYKLNNPPVLPLMGLGVTAACRSTGLVANTTNTSNSKDKEIYPISNATAAKLAISEQATERLRKIFPDSVWRAKYEIPRDFDDFGRSKHEMSYIAIVHADGNEMGKFFQKIGQKAKSPREYITLMRKASNNVEIASTEALRTTIMALCNAIVYDESTGKDTINGTVTLTDNYLPIRPLVFGGDDVTFVCDGRLGLTLAALYLKAFEEETQKLQLDDKKGLHACAGISVVKTHYPFSRAYQLSESLAKEAKKYVHDSHKDGFSALDWHFATGGLIGNLTEIRQREYKVQELSLMLRPMALNAIGDTWRTWDSFSRTVEDFQLKAQSSRNKIMKLREILRQGPEATEKYLELTGVKLPVIDEGICDIKESGWYDNTCMYFDAIEAMDFYVPLTKKEEK